MSVETDFLNEAHKLCDEGKLEEALAVIDKALEHTMWWNEMDYISLFTTFGANICTSMQDFERAKHYYELNLEWCYPADPIVLMHLGKICYLLNDQESAIYYFKRCHEFATFKRRRTVLTLLRKQLKELGINQKEVFIKKDSAI
jgi:tetratricopeptide (TPR) repeat protein